MKMLKDENEYTYGDFRELKCGGVQKNHPGKGSGDNQQLENNMPTVRHDLFL